MSSLLEFHGSHFVSEWNKTVGFVLTGEGYWHHTRDCRKAMGGGQEREIEGPRE